MSNTTVVDPGSSLPVPTSESSTIGSTTTAATTASSSAVPTTSSTLESPSSTPYSARSSSRILASSTRYTESSSSTSTASASTISSAPSSNDPSSNVGAIVGGVVGGVGGLLLLALFGFLIYKFFGCCGKGGTNNKRQKNDSTDKHGVDSYEYDVDYNSYGTSAPPTRQHSTIRANDHSLMNGGDQFTPRPFVPAYDPIAAKEGAAYNTRYKEIFTGDHGIYGGGDHLHTPNQYEVPGQNYTSDTSRNVPNEMDYSRRYVPNEI